MYKATQRYFLLFIFLKYLFANKTSEIIEDNSSKDCIRISIQSTRRIELLQRFLAAKTYENSEKMVS